MAASLIRVLLLLGLLAAPAVAAAAAAPTPVVLDTDIGTDIDDAYAVAMILQSRGLALKAVTTVSGDAAARARIVAKMLADAGHPEVPVAAGAFDKRDPFAQAKYGANYHGANLVSTPAVELLKQAIDREHGRMVVIAIGPLTNIAALLKAHPDEKRRIREIVLMGGSVAHGYTPGSAPVAEYNIAADTGASQAVFRAGVPLLVAPLDVTAQLQLSAGERQQIEARHTPLSEALRQLYALWDGEHNKWAPRDSAGHSIPTLHDAMAVALLTFPRLCQQTRMDLEITGDGKTVPGQGLANATVAVRVDPAEFLSRYELLFSH